MAQILSYNRFLSSNNFESYISCTLSFFFHSVVVQKIFDVFSLLQKYCNEHLREMLLPSNGNTIALAFYSIPIYQDSGPSGGQAFTMLQM